MALSFVKKKAASADVAPEATAAPAEKPKVAVAQKTAPMGWLKRGKSATAAMAQEEAKAEDRKAEYGKLWRFFIKPGESARVTFLDGELNDEAMLNCMVCNEHRCMVASDTRYFICTAGLNDEGQFDEQAPPCPICEKGDKAAFEGFFTILDHRQHKIKSGPNAGKIIANTRKLFVAKRTTIKLLSHYAGKHGNKLAGCTFDIKRTSDKNPAVGDIFDFVEQFTKLSDLAGKYELELADVQPANYEEELSWRTNAELIELGVGKAQSGPGYEKKTTGGLKDQL